MMVTVLAAAGLSAAEKVGNIEFFGYEGLDVAKVRASLPVHEGDEYTAASKDAIRQAVARATGKEPTDIAAICCDDNGDRLVFIGLQGASYTPFRYAATPTGGERLPDEIMDIYARTNRALEAAVRMGGDAASEDDSNGYALIKEPKARALQMEIRAWALEHETQIVRALANSSSAEDRRVASDALGYGRQSTAQLAALVQASRDPDDEVRNNATRALTVLVRSNPKLGAEIPVDTFVGLLKSGTWTDRNKGAALLAEISAAREPASLIKLRSDALPALIEMTLWRKPSHAYFPRLILGRIAGIPEEKLRKLAWDGPAREIVDAVSGK